jgi:RNA polymerase sigma-70 factor (ECF subfamily)
VKTRCSADLSGPARSDEDLLARYQGGDLDSFGELYRRHSRPLFLYLRVLTGDSAVAEDAVHEAFMRLLDRVSTTAIDCFRTYLYAAARHIVIDHGRRSEKRKSSEPLVVLRTAGPGAERGLAEDVSRAIASLPGDQREVVVLKVYADLTFAEIAQLTSQPPGTVMSRYRYALGKLARMLGKA